MRELRESELEYIVSRILENAMEAQEESRGTDFQDGRRLAYYEMADTIKNELETRGIDLKKYGLDFKLESILESRRTAKQV